VLLAFSGEPGALHDQIRRDGHLVRTGDRVAGLTGISAPVWRAGGTAGAAPVLVGSLTLTVPEPRMRPELVGALREAAARLSAALGAG
jgi:DNA-binding IclR family transcriptional regulator